MRTSLLAGASSFAVLIGLGANPALAQVVGPPEVVVPDQEEDPAEDEEVARDASGQEAEGTITITGSRIRLPNLDSFEPIVTLDEEYIEDRNLSNAADALNELPSFRGSVTPAGAQGTFGQGVNFVNNFGLGSNRTLTLVNGRRYVSSNVPNLFNNASQGTQVDLNVIPTALIDRIDTVAVGGAPVYGSDAISGTVNIILKNNYEGAELRAISSITEEGDNFTYQVAGIWGTNLGDSANLTVSVDYNETNGVHQNERDFFAAGFGNASNPSSAQAAALGPVGRSPTNDFRVNPNIGFNNSADDDNPGTVLVRGLTIPFLTRGGLITLANGGTGATLVRNVQFDQDGNLVPFNQGVPFLGINAAGGDGFTFQEFSQITSDVRRFIVNGLFNIDVADNINFFVEGTYFNSRADELVQQPTFNSSLFGGTSGPLTFAPNNPFLTDQARAVLQSRGVTVFQVSRASIDLADLTGFGKNEIVRGVMGLQGDFTIGDRNFNWEISANYGVADIITVRQDLNAQNFANAVNVTRDAAGQIVCTTAQTRPGGFAAPGRTPVADPACVPLNLFGEGRASQEARDYVIAENRSKAQLEQFVVNANVGGTLFDLWGAGLTGFNVGFEHRREEAGFTPSAFEQAGSGRSVAIGPVGGDYTINEVFGEVLVPLIGPDNNFPIVNRAEVFGRGRYVHNTVNGGFFAWAAGGAIAPIPDIEFRGNFTKSFRAPAITELFQPRGNIFTSVPDLCSPAARNAGPVPEVRARNCAAFLAVFPNATPLLAASATVPGISGGDPNLENEEADSYTFGVILRPRFIPRLAITADYIDINLTNPIAFLSAAQIASACFDNEQFNASDPANGNQFCSLIRRDASGQVPADPADPAVVTGFTNGNRITFSGIQGTVNYSTARGDFGLPGSLEIGGELLYVRRRLVDITGVAPSRSDGTLGDPEFAGQLRLRYTTDDYGLATYINYVGEQVFSRTNRNDRDIREFDQLEDYVTVDASVFFNAGPMRLTLSVDNVFNRQGQEYFGTFIPASINDALGRRFSAGARVRF